MIQKYLHFLVLIAFIFLSSVNSNVVGENRIDKGDSIIPLQNPISVEYLKEHLQKESPRLVLTPEIELVLKEKLKIDPQMQAYFKYMKEEADRVLQKPLIAYKKTGRRLLSVTRDFISRMGALCLVYRIEKDPVILKRIDDELKAICSFKDWNPSHYLDVAEASFGVAIAVDWAGDDLPEETVNLAVDALINKGIKPSFNHSMFWIRTNHNWNQVCHGGMVAAALVVAEENPGLAAKTIKRALKYIPNALKEYMPDGVYPEGPGYWNYGTAYTILTSSMLTTALSTDFGIGDYQGFMESAKFIQLSTAPSGDYFNYSDCGLHRGKSTSVLLSWFAAKTGDGLFFDKDFFDHPSNAGRFAAAGMIWLSQYNEKKISTLPLAWYGNGSNPVVIFRAEKDDPSQFYLAAKGGLAHINHGNMDAGTFIFELDGVRWAIDPGSQNYNELEQAGFNLWASCQECERWTLMTKSNKGHSTLTVDDALHNVHGFAPVTEFKVGNKPEAVIDLSEVFKGRLESASRKFRKESPHSLLIEDSVVLEDSTQTVTWALMTTAEVKVTVKGAVLMQDGKKLHLTIFSPGTAEVSVVSLDPPPLKLDKTIKGLKRIEINCPAVVFSNGKGVIKVRLKGE